MLSVEYTNHLFLITVKYSFKPQLRTCEYCTILNLDCGFACSKQEEHSCSVACTSLSFHFACFSFLSDSLNKSYRVIILYRRYAPTEYPNKSRTTTQKKTILPRQNR